MLDHGIQRTDSLMIGVGGAEGRSTSVEMLEAINKIQFQVEQQIKSQKLPKVEIVFRWKSFELLSRH